MSWLSACLPLALQFVSIIGNAIAASQEHTAVQKQEAHDAIAEQLEKTRARVAAAIPR